MRQFRQMPALLGLLSLLLCGCGGDGDTGGGTSPDNGAGDTVASDSGGGAQDSGGGQGAVVNLTPVAIPVNVQETPTRKFQYTLTGRIARPVTCQAATPCQLIVVVADREVGPVPAWEGPAIKLAQATGAVVLIFNLPGMGSGGMISGDLSYNDYGGNHHVTAVKEAMRLTCSPSKDYIDQKRCGFLTVGFGLVPVARALQVHGLNSLKFVQYLVDVEGPTDRCAISESPEDKAKGIGPDDGPGVTDTACNFSKTSPHSKTYPPAKDGKPASIVCSESAWPITKTGMDCSENIWWQNREPSRALQYIAPRYWRLQFKYDHRLPSHEASRTAIKSLVSSKSQFFALNLAGAPCSSPPTDEACEGAGCWLEGDWGNGMAPAPYAGPDFKPVSLDDLFGKVVPKYVLWAADEAKVPNCK